MTSGQDRPASNFFIVLLEKVPSEILNVGKKLQKIFRYKRQPCLKCVQVMENINIWDNSYSYNFLTFIQKLEFGMLRYKLPWKNWDFSSYKMKFVWLFDILSEFPMKFRRFWISNNKNFNYIDWKDFLGLRSNSSCIVINKYNL